MDYTIYVEKAREELIDKYGEVRPVWEALLNLLEDEFKLLARVQREISETKLYDAETMRCNPCLVKQKELIATILKIYQQLTCTPWVSSKIDTSEKESKDLLKELVG